MITQKVVCGCTRCCIRFILRHNLARDKRDKRDLRNESRPANRQNSATAAPFKDVPLYFHYSDELRNKSGKQADKRSDGKSTVADHRTIVVDRLQIVLCDDRRPEEAANISRRTMGRGSIRIPRTNERTIERTVIDDASCRCIARNARAFFQHVHTHVGCVSRGGDGPYPSVYALILICRPSCSPLPPSWPIVCVQ